MATFRIALNMEFCRSADKSFEDGVRIAAELGYRHVEPMVHTGWELLSEVGYFHSFSMEEDPLLMIRLLGAQIEHVHWEDLPATLEIAGDEAVIESRRYLEGLMQAAAAERPREGARA